MSPLAHTILWLVTVGFVAVGLLLRFIVVIVVCGLDIYEACERSWSSCSHCSCCGGRNGAPEFSTELQNLPTQNQRADRENPVGSYGLNDYQVEPLLRRMAEMYISK
jgi:hypothetical protein